MKKLYDSMAFQANPAEPSSCSDKTEISYAVDRGDEDTPYLHLAISTPQQSGSSNDLKLDISREDMVEILNDIVDEWPEIVDSMFTGIKEGVEVIPTFS